MNHGDDLSLPPSRHYYKYHGTNTNHNQGCQIGFFWSQIPEIWFFLKLGWRHKIHLAFWFFPGVLHAKIICTKMTYHPFYKPFSLRKKIFLVCYIWQYCCHLESGQEGAIRQPVSRRNTMDTWHVWVVPGRVTSDLRSVWMWFITILIYCDQRPE
jgi:hypothetical protein